MSKRAKIKPISVVLGKRGHGKSTVVKALLKSSTSKRIIVIDTLGEYATKGAKVFTSPAALIKHVRDNKTFKIIARFEQNEKVAFDFVCRAAYTAGNILLVIEEIDWYISAGHAPEPFGTLVRYGRHQDVEMICVARRPADMWRNLTANADFIYSCRITEPRDLEYLRSCLSREIAERIAKLKRYEYLICTDDEVKSGKTRL